MVTTEEWVGISVVREDKETILITTTITSEEEEEDEATAVKVWTIKRLEILSRKCMRTE